MGTTYDFSGYATRNDLKCSDGRVIRRDAFKDCDGAVVPIVWQHVHNDIGSVLGHGLLENREDGVFVYGSFNSTPAGKNAKAMVDHGDITNLSIYANKLKQNGTDVVHGIIREVSLVLAGANPGAYIESLAVEHSEDGSDDLTGGEALFYAPDDDYIIIHAADDEEDEDDEDEIDEDEDEEDVSDESEDDDEEDEEDEESSSKKDKKIQHSEGESMAKEETVGDVFNTLSEKQKTVVYALIGQALEDAGKGNDDMKHNLFDAEENEKNVLSHADVEAIFTDAKRVGSLKDAYEDFCLQHDDYGLTDHNGNLVSYGVANIDYLFPDYKNYTNQPEFIKRETDWVRDVMGGVHHTPFSRVKSIFADITMDEARARGYIKGNLKVNEVFTLLKRTTDPQTVYKKQKLDRDDIIDITDFDVVAWIKNEMRGMLDEELARAYLIGDGRETSDNDHISHDHIRPIWTDSDLFTIKKKVEFANNASIGAKAKDVIKAAVRARKDYKGSGNPVLFTTEDWVTEMLLIEDLNGRPIYDTIEKLATAMRVRKIVTVPVMENQTREYTEGGAAHTMELIGIIVNLADYNVGADKGGAVNMFDDFDIDYNQYAYLIETRCSGALAKPYSAIVLETEIPSEDEE